MTTFNINDRIKDVTNDRHVGRVVSIVERGYFVMPRNTKKPVFFPKEQAEAVRVVPRYDERTLEMSRLIGLPPDEVERERRLAGQIE